MTGPEQAGDDLRLGSVGAGRVDPEVKPEAGKWAAVVVTLSAVAVEVAERRALLGGGGLDARRVRPPAGAQAADQVPLDLSTPKPSHQWS